MGERQPGADGGTEIAPDDEEDRPAAREAADAPGRAEDRRPAADAPLIPGTCGSLDDVPADAAGTPVAEEEPPDG